MKAAFVLAPVAAVAIFAAGLAGAQDDRRIRPEQGLPLLAPAAAEPVARGRPLTAEQQRSFGEARSERMAGRFDHARQILQALLATVPHHPMVLAELTAVLAEREDWAAVERVARGERRALRDSVLLAHELAHALGRLGRTREAVGVAVEAWAASPVEQEWARSVIGRASGPDARAARDLMRRAAAGRPLRPDLATGSARLEAAAGDVRPALAALGAADRAQGRWRLRGMFAEELLSSGETRDTVSAGEVLLDLAADAAGDPGYRVAAAQRFWELSAARAETRAGAPRVRRSLAGVPLEQWNQELRLAVARELREAGHTAEVRELLSSAGPRDATPDFELERLLNDLREGPPAGVLGRLRVLAEENPATAYRYAEALFYAGELDSAHVWFTRAAADPASPDAGAALERLYLLEEESSREALPCFGRIAYAMWRGDLVTARTLADSLFQALPRGPLWAQAALLSSSAHEDDPHAALAPLLAVADSLPGDRLAPLARQRAGDLCATRLKDDAQAIHHYEECLIRYPRAWNAAEVRRKLEQLRRDRRL